MKGQGMRLKIKKDLSSLLKVLMDSALRIISVSSVGRPEAETYPERNWIAIEVVGRCAEGEEMALSISQSVNIRLLRHGKMQANNSKQKGNAVSKKKCRSRKNKPGNWAQYVFLYNRRVRKLESRIIVLNVQATVGSADDVWGYSVVRRWVGGGGKGR